MSDSVIIAEVSKGALSPVTAELVSAAKAYGTNPVMVIPCTDASIADGSGYEGVSRVIAVKGDCFANYDAASWASALDAAAPSGVIFAAVPASIFPNVITPSFPGFFFLLIIDCAEIIKFAAI